MYSKQGLRVRFMSIIAGIQMKLVPPIRQNPGVIRHWGGSTAPFHYKDDNRRFATSSTAYKNGYKRGPVPDIHTNFSFSSCQNAYLPHQLISTTYPYNWLAVKDHPRLYCSKEERKENKDSKSLSIFQRFKQAYKQHGKVLVGVHVATSTVWLGCFYYLAQSGFDIVPLLESLRVSESIVDSFKQSGLGNVASAYLMYKVATPARYTVTLAGTNLAIRYFRKTGRMEPVPESSKFRQLYKDSKKYLSIRRKQLKKKQMAKMKKRLNKFSKFKKRYR